MLIVNTENIPGRRYEVLGLVRGSVVQSKNFGKDFMSAMKTLVGGEIVAYTELLQEARQIAMGRMVAQAEELGADAIVCLRYASSSVMQGAAEVISYGTAVRFTDK
ncbi:heavy metal-binding domain-containing protein [Gemmiger formicilis]|uniref:heavy metal-binding domain-containing protein n=1 Tax=Gemmiger formicilis TaxID=745368 RepID=UPI00195EA43E|nr:heavy metal-binding domain-containing protein [Gemmiger formicilis]MBM6916225.1 heavy metal-binding domain-containing protein [Gemmiger formicilis]HIX32881.1 heavy metal-binding domain-containing protein [Candidatus Gemmiger avium]